MVSYFRCRILIVLKDQTVLLTAMMSAKKRGARARGPLSKTLGGVIVLLEPHPA